MSTADIMAHVKKRMLENPKAREPTLEELIAPVLSILRKSYRQKAGSPRGFKYKGLDVPSATMTIDKTFFTAENILYHKERGRDLMYMALLVIHNQGRMLGEREERRRNEELERLRR